MNQASSAAESLIKDYRKFKKTQGKKAKKTKPKSKPFGNQNLYFGLFIFGLISTGIYLFLLQFC